MGKYTYAVPPDFDLSDKGLASRQHYHLARQREDKTLCKKTITDKWKKIKSPTPVPETELCWNCVQSDEKQKQKDFDLSILPSPPDGYIRVYKLYRTEDGKQQYMMHFRPSEQDITVCLQDSSKLFSERDDLKIPVKMCKKCARSSFFIQKYLAYSDGSK